MKQIDPFEEALARFRGKRPDSGSESPDEPTAAPVASDQSPEQKPADVEWSSTAVAQIVDSHRLISVPARTLRIDRDQPRRYLPADLRRAFAGASLSAEQVLQELSARAGAGDAEAAGYLHGIAELAASLDDVGLRQPLEVRSLSADPPAYEIVDGERRFWAHVFSCARRRASLDDNRLPVLLRVEEESIEDVGRAQWAVNDQRQDVPAMAFAETVARIYRSVYDRVINRRRETCELFGRAYDETTDPRSLAMELAVIAVKRETGRELTVKSLYRYLQAAEGLAPQAKAVASAYSFSLRSLTRLAQIKSANEQARLARQLALPESAAPQPTEPAASHSRPGRKTAIQKHIQLFCELEAVAAKPDKLLKSLRKSSPDEQDEYLHMLATQREWIDRLHADALRALGRHSHA